MDLRLKSVYVPPEPSDGYRVLIDQRWPRGVAHVLADLDAWPKCLAPSTELREWFDHDPARYREFRRRYIDELRDQRLHLAELRHLAERQTVTLVYDARDTEPNDATVLSEVLRQGLPTDQP